MTTPAVLAVLAIAAAVCVLLELGIEFFAGTII